jgi:hypothetical protein
VLGVKDRKNGIARAELDTVIGFQLLALHPLAINERSVLAALVLDENFAVLRDEKGVIAGHTRICNHQVLVHFATDAKWRVM